MTCTVREPTVDDADAMGALHVRAWQAAYRDGLMPDEYLDGLVAEERAEQWRSVLPNPPRPKSYRLVAETDDGGVVAFAMVGPAGGEADAVVGELYAINVDPDHWGTGVGSTLIDVALARLVDDGFDRAILWVHPGNQRARRFYESRGWVDDQRERREVVLDIEVPEARYSRAF